MKQSRKRALALILLALLSVAGVPGQRAKSPAKRGTNQRPAKSAQKNPASKDFDLTGFWITDRGEEVELLDLKPVPHVDSFFTAKSHVGACPISKPPNDRRPFFIDGTLQGKTLKGRMMRCTGIPDLIHKCGQDPAYETTFTATVEKNRISGTYRTQWYDEQKPDSQGCKYRRDPAGDSDKAFSLTRCSPDNKALCSALAAVRKTISQMIDLNFHTPTEKEWSQILSSNKPKLDAQFDEVRARVCGDKAAQDKIDQMMKTLASLGYGKEAPTKQMLKVAGIDIELQAMATSRCGAVPRSNDPCKEFSNFALDGLQTFFERADELKDSYRPDGDAYEMVDDGINDAIKDLQEEARSARDHPSTVGNLDQYIEEHNRKIAKLRALLGYWDQFKAASCLPPEINQLLRRLAREKKTGEEHQATCTELCGKTADWIVRMTGDQRQRKTVFESCFAQCR